MRDLFFDLFAPSISEGAVVDRLTDSVAPFRVAVSTIETSLLASTTLATALPKRATNRLSPAPIRRGPRARPQAPQPADRTA